MNLVDIILQNVDVVDYYEDYIRPMEPKFQPYSMVGNKLVLCYFHDHMDLNPSFGYYTKKENGISYKLYHCFGCHKTGNVIRLHQQMQYQYYQKKLTEKEACLELAKLYDINVDDFEDVSDDDYEKKFAKQYRRIDVIKSNYSRKSFADDLLEMRKSGKIYLDGRGSVNNASVKLIATIKQLYD